MINHTPFAIIPNRVCVVSREGWAIKITDDAKEYIQKRLEKSKSKNILRVYLAGVGWGGPVVQVALDGLQENEKAQDINGVPTVIDPRLKQVSRNYVVELQKLLGIKWLSIRTGVVSNC